MMKSVAIILKVKSGTFARNAGAQNCTGVFSNYSFRVVQNAVQFCMKVEVSGEHNCPCSPIQKERTSIEIK